MRGESLLRVGDEGRGSARDKTQMLHPQAARSPPAFGGSDARFERTSLYFRRSYLAQVSRSVTLRLNTGVDALWSRRSATK